MTPSQEYIRPEELRQFFNGKALQRIKHGSFESGVHLLQLTWPHKGLPFNQQALWILYHPTDPDAINSILEDLIKVSELCNGKTVIIDASHPDWWAYEIITLSDGCMRGNRVSITYPGGVEGQFGWITGQGRDLPVEENPVLRGMVQLLVSICLNDPNDLFLAEGMKRLGHLLENHKDG